MVSSARGKAAVVVFTRVLSVFSECVQLVGLRAARIQRPIRGSGDGWKSLAGAPELTPVLRQESPADKTGTYSQTNIYSDTFNISHIITVYSLWFRQW